MKKRCTIFGDTQDSKTLDNILMSEMLSDASNACVKNAYVCKFIVSKIKRQKKHGTQFVAHA